MAYSAVSFFLGLPLQQRTLPSTAERLGTGRPRTSTATTTAPVGSHTTAPTTMKIRIGLVGLPNVGKSSLFNSLARQAIAAAENYPFCTIEPNVAPLPVPDPFLEKLRVMSGKSKIAPAVMEWVDVAGLCRGASKGEGLGNRFLGTIRDVDVVAHVVRVFSMRGPEGGSSGRDQVHHVQGMVNPANDIGVINLELLLADLDHVERRLDKTTCRGLERQVLEKVHETLLAGKPARQAPGLDSGAKFAIKSMGLLTLKPVLYCFNVDEADFTLARGAATEQAADILKEVLEEEITSMNNGEDSSSNSIGIPFALVSAKLESELSDLPESEQIAFLKDLGAPSDCSMTDFLSCNLLPAKVQELLDLHVAYTGPGVPNERSMTVKAHLFKRESLTADTLASRLHGDIHKGFIQAEVISVQQLLGYPSYASAKQAGMVRGEGRDYRVQPHDVVLIKWK